MVKKFRKRRKASPHKLGDRIYCFLESFGGHCARKKIPELWKNWDTLMGSTICQLISACESQSSTLLIKVGNSMQMQTLLFHKDEILERANSYLGRRYFREVRLCLATETRKKSEKFQLSQSEERVFPVRRSATGVFLPEMDMNSPVAKCYALFSGIPK